MSSLFFRLADKSWWRSAPPDEHRAIDAIASIAVENALAAGDIPRIENGQLRIYSKNDPPADLLQRAMRQERNFLLAQCDWTQATDVELTIAQRKAWMDYRRALRRVPQQFPDGRNISWPKAPE